VTEELRSKSQADALISRTKIFIKPPACKMQFKSMVPGVPLPPKPMITRWGTSIDATVYYCDHFQVVKNTVDSMEDVRATEAAQNDSLAAKWKDSWPS
jgi:hypothetical protein